MHIWLINHYLILPHRPGGTRHFQLAKQLVQKGVKVTLIAANFDHFTKQFVTENPKKITLENLEGIDILWLPVNAYQDNSPKRVFNMFYFALQLLKRKNTQPLQAPDLILGTSPHLFSTWAGHRLAKRWKVPFLMEIRDLWPESLIQLGNISRKHPFILLLKHIEKSLYQKADHIITLLPGSESYIRTQSNCPNPIDWLPNFVDVNTLPKANPTQQPNETYTIIYAGSHGLANHLDFILDAVKSIPLNDLPLPCQIIFIGNGPEKDRLKQRVKEENIPLIAFEDPIEKNKIYTRLAQADAFIVALKDSPLYQWGISLNKLFDYMAMGKPTLFAGNAPHNPIDEAKAGLVVDAKNPEHLAKAITTLISMPRKEQNQLGQNGRQYLEAHHDLNQLSHKLYDICQNMISIKPSKTRTK